MPLSMSTATNSGSEHDTQSPAGTGDTKHLCELFKRATNKKQSINVTQEQITHGCFSITIKYYKGTMFSYLQ